MTALKREMAETLHQLNSFKQQIHANLATLSNTQSALEQIKDEKTALQQQKATLEKQLLDTKQHLQGSQEESRTLQVEVEKTSSKVTDLERSLKERDHKIGEMEEVVSAHEAKLMRAREAIETLRRERSDLTNYQATLKADLENLQLQYDHLQHTQSSITEKEDPGEDQKLMEELQSLKTTFAEKEGELASMEQEKSRLAAEMAHLREELNAQADPPHIDPQVPSFKGGQVSASGSGDSLSVSLSLGQPTPPSIDGCRSH